MTISLVAKTPFILQLIFIELHTNSNNNIPTVSVDAMTEHQNLNKNDTSRAHGETKNSDNNGGSSYSGHKIRYPNPRETSNPDPTTLREQWRFAIRKFSRSYSRAWGTAVLAGVSLFAIGWFIKGSNPLSFNQSQDPPQSHSPSPPSDADD